MVNMYAYSPFVICPDNRNIVRRSSTAATSHRNNMRIIHWVCGDSWRRFVVSVIAALLAFLALREEITFPTSAIAVWDSFAAIAITLAWVAIGMTPPARLREHAQAQDLSRLLIFGLVVIASCAALFAVAVLIRNHHAEMRTGARIAVRGAGSMG